MSRYVSPLQLTQRVVMVVIPALSLVMSGLLAVLYFQNDQSHLISPAHANSAEYVQSLLSTRDDDRNGTLDWEEVFSRLEGETQSHGQSTYEFTTNTNSSSSSVTDTVGRELLGTYLAMRRQGELGLGDKEALLKRVIATAQESALSIPITTQNDVVTTQDTTDSAYRVYHTRLTECTVPLTSFKTNELLLFGLTLERGDVDAKAELGALARAYMDVAHCMRTVPTPQVFIDAHVSMINHLDVWAYDLESLYAYDSDPIRTLSRISLIDKDQKNARVALVNLMELLKKYVR